MGEPPKLENCPGHIIVRRARDYSVRWQARWELVEKGYLPRSIRIAVIDDNPTPGEVAFISKQCHDFQNDMLAWARGGAPETPGLFDGTIAALVHCYQTDPDSDYHSKRYVSRKNYQSFLRRIVKDHGDFRIADIKGREVKRWYEDWLVSGLTMAGGLMTMLRILMTFGSTILDDKHCRAAKELLADMRFKGTKARVDVLTAEQATAIRKLARERGHKSVALCQAVQFDLMLRQKDCLGEWVPLEEPGTSDVTADRGKWLRGIRWSEIDGNLILRHTTSKRNKEIEVDLKLAPMVMEELQADYPGILQDRNVAPVSGPLIVSENTDRPWDANAFRKLWRALATELGVPKTVRNMDSRAGAITEATQAKAPLEWVQQAATHSDISTTQGYARGGTEKTAEVMRLRVAHRNKGETK